MEVCSGNARCHFTFPLPAPADNGYPFRCPSERPSRAVPAAAGSTSGFRASAERGEQMSALGQCPDQQVSRMLIARSSLRSLPGIGLESGKTAAVLLGLSAIHGDASLAAPLLGA